MSNLTTGSAANCRWPLNRNIRIIIILFGVFLLAVIWLSLYWKIQSERQLAISGALKDTANFARAFEEHTLRTIKSMDQIVLFLKYQYEQTGRAMQIPQYIKEGKLTNQPFVFLGVIDETGELAVSSPVPLVSPNLRDREHFSIHQAYDSGQLFISKPVQGRSSGKWSIQLTRRVNKPDGSFGGAAVVAVDPFYFTEFYKQVDLGEQSSIALVGRDGIIRARETGATADVGEDDREQSTLLQQLAVSAAGHYFDTSAIDGVKRIHSYRAVRDYPFVVSVGISEQEVFRELNERVGGYYRVAGITSVIIATFIFLLLRSTTRQQHIEGELEQIRDNLEVEVGQRTEELYVANKELIAMNETHIAMNEELLHTNTELENEITDRRRIEEILYASKQELEQKNYDLTAALTTIEVTQKQLIQQEKLAGIGQLAAGVAHEINNPLGFVTGNVETLAQYFTAFRSVLNQYRKLSAEAMAGNDLSLKAGLEQIARYEQEQDLDYILNDFPELFQDTVEGLERMSKIVRGMCLFSRVNQHVIESYDLNDGLESTLLVAHNEIKYHASVEKSLGAIPPIEADSGEINQVLLNLIVNAAQAIKDKHTAGTGVIKISTWQEGAFVYCTIQDNGSGITAENLNNIFNPFFTTKPVGQGTGMGLSISYDIIVNQYSGEIAVVSVAGEGAKFTLKLPIKHELMPGA